MTLTAQTNTHNSENISDRELGKKVEAEKILCMHCKRTASNGIKCKGICVADSDY